MKSKRAWRIVLLLCALFVVAMGALVFWKAPGVKVIGHLSSRDVTQIRNFHQADFVTSTGPAWYQRFCPASVRRPIAGALNPIDEIYVQEDGSVIVVYRTSLQPGYRSDGTQVWRRGSYHLKRATNGWARL